MYMYVKISILWEQVDGKMLFLPTYPPYFLACNRNHK